MELLISFGIGLLLGIIVGVGVALLINWMNEKVQRQHSFDDFVEKIEKETDKVKTLLSDEMGNRRQTFGSISSQLSGAAQQTSELVKVTHALSTALAHPTIRGQWGERMVEDILAPIGFVEGINYVKQSTTVGVTQGRPDFTFFLPRDFKVNLDSKFPLDNYLAYSKSKNEHERKELRKKFLGDVRRRMKELANKEYINPEAKTVDFVLLFIPNEQVYSFINVYDPTFFDEAIANKVVLCSPWTLYPVISIIHKSIDNFILEKTTSELLPLMNGFDKQWQEFNSCLEKIGKKISEAQKEYEHLIGTRQRQLDKVLNQIDSLRQQKDFRMLTEEVP